MTDAAVITPATAVSNGAETSGSELPTVRNLQDGVLVFGAAWCPVTRPLLRSLEDALNGAKAVAVDVDVDPASADLWQVSVLPTFVHVVGGRETGRVWGAVAARQLLKRTTAPAPAPAQAKSRRRK